MYRRIVPTRIVLMNQIVHLNTVNCIVRAWNITSLKSRYLPAFLKLGYGKKVIKDNTLRPILSFHSFHQYLKDNAVRPILSSQGYYLTHIVLSKILYKFPSKARVLFLFQASFEKLESGTIQVDPFCRFRKIRSTFVQLMVLCWIFFIISSGFWQGGNTVWPLLSFQKSHILPFQGSNESFKLELKYVLVSKVFLKKLYHGQYGFTHIVHLRSYRNFHLSCYIFSCSDVY